MGCSLYLCAQGQSFEEYCLPGGKGRGNNEAYLGKVRRALRGVSELQTSKVLDHKREPVSLSKERGSPQKGIG